MTAHFRESPPIIENHHVFLFSTVDDHGLNYLIVDRFAIRGENRVFLFSGSASLLGGDRSGMDHWTSGYCQEECLCVAQRLHPSQRDLGIPWMELDQKVSQTCRDKWYQNVLSSQYFSGWRCETGPGLLGLWRVSLFWYVMRSPWLQICALIIIHLLVSLRRQWQI